MAIKGDAGSIAFLEELVNQTVEKFGKIDILIPNAGVLPMANLESAAEEILLSTMQNVAFTVTPTYLLYNATKGGIEQMVRAMSKS